MKPLHAGTTARTGTSDRASAGTRRLNLGVLAHVDAGKTSLSEALLHVGGAIDRPGRVDDGTTQTDTLSLERQRGITIRAAVATFGIGDVTVNLVDTPGHPDSIAEVARSLTVLDGAILVLSAVEGVQAQTIVLYRVLRLGIPTVFFVNKIDRPGAAPQRVVDAVRDRLGAAVVPLGRVTAAGAVAADTVPFRWDDDADVEELTSRLADQDDELLGEWIARGCPPSQQRLRSVLRRLMRDGSVHPVMFGSARTGSGVRYLIETVADLLPGKTVASDVPAAAQVFKIERSAGGRRVCTVRVRAGTLRVRDRVSLTDGAAVADEATPAGVLTGIVTGLKVFEPGGPVARASAAAGQIARVRGLDTARIGDRIGAWPADRRQPALPEPGFETRVVARDGTRHGDLHRALTELADIDPLITVRPDRGAVRIRVYGQVQQEVLADALAAEYGIDVDFHDTAVVCVERPARPAHSVRRLGEPGHLHQVTLGVRIEPLAPGQGIELAVAADRESLPLHVYSSVEGYRAALLDYLTEPLAAGPRGWPVTDVRVTVTDSGYVPPSPRPPDVRRTLDVVVREAVARAGTVLCEPIDRFELEVPVASLAAALGLLARHGAAPDKEGWWPRASRPSRFRHARGGKSLVSAHDQSWRRAAGDP